MNNNKNDKVVTRVALTKENEIDYYKYKINLLENVREENRNVIKNCNETIRELKETIIKMINGEDIFTFKTMNEIRDIFGLKPIQNITNETNQYTYRLDMGNIDYTTITYYQNGEPIKEETIQYK